MEFTGLEIWSEITDEMWLGLCQISGEISKTGMSWVWSYMESCAITDYLEHNIRPESEGNLVQQFMVMNSSVYNVSIFDGNPLSTFTS